MVYTVRQSRYSNGAMMASRLTLVLVCVLSVAWIRAVDYATARTAAIAGCEAIDPSAYQSGLYFNPDGYRSYYEQSECFQRVAVQFRDDSLCAKVRQRRSVFASSWGYSGAQCRKLVSEGIAADFAELDGMRQKYAQGAVQLRTFRIERNGNGRDFDIIPVFSGSYAHGYRLTFEILGASSSGAPALIHSSGYYLDATANLRIYVPQADIRYRFPGFMLGRPYQVRATAILDVGNGGQAGYWSDAFIERVFPVRSRSQSVSIETVF